MPMQRTMPQMPKPKEPAMPMPLRHPMHDLAARASRHPSDRTSTPWRWTGAAYAAVLLAALCGAWLQSDDAEASAHDAALLSLASWAAGGLADGDTAPRALPVTPQR